MERLDSSFLDRSPEKAPERPGASAAGHAQQGMALSRVVAFGRFVGVLVIRALLFRVYLSP